MAAALYDKGRNRFARGDILWKAAAGSTIRVCLVKDDYTPSLSTHEFFSDLGANVVGNAGSATRTNCPTMTLLDPSAGVCDGDDVTLTLVPGSVGICNYICIFLDSGADGTSPLIALIDDATGIPVTPGGGNILITWDSGTNKIFKL
jgi:hypothetical protein